MNKSSPQDDAIARIRGGMEVITADGRCAGHISACEATQIFVGKSHQAIPKEWIRRVDREVYISKRWYELPH